MKIYDDKHIKNVVLVGATKSGKTTLAESMLFTGAESQSAAAREA